MIRTRIQDFSCRVYITDCLRVLAMGKRYERDIQRWEDFTEPGKRAKDTRTGDEIALDVIKRAGLVVTD